MHNNNEPVSYYTLYYDITYIDNGSICAQLSVGDNPLVHFCMA